MKLNVKDLQRERVIMDEGFVLPCCQNFGETNCFHRKL